MTVVRLVDVRARAASIRGRGRQRRNSPRLENEPHRSPLNTGAVVRRKVQVSRSNAKQQPGREHQRRQDPVGTSANHGVGPLADIKSRADIVRCEKDIDAVLEGSASRHRRRPGRGFLAAEPRYQGATDGRSLGNQAATDRGITTMPGGGSASFILPTARPWFPCGGTAISKSKRRA